MDADKIELLLKDYGQEHIIPFLRRNSGKKCGNFLEQQLSEINWRELSELINSHVLNKPEVELPDELIPAEYFPAEPDSKKMDTLYRKAKNEGKRLLRNNKVAALTVAGGQGTRLGYDGPKGSFPITPLKKKSLFKYFAESIIHSEEKYDSEILWFIMTSKMNDEASRKFFAENNYFGMKPENVNFFVQGTMPAVDYEGKLLMADESSLALSPDGHGGTLLALRKSGMLEKMEQNGVEHISYFQVDNPLVSVVNPLFIGLHHLENSEMSSIMLAKTGPFEKLGNFCRSHGRLYIIEYSDMPEELAESRDENGGLRFTAGSPAIHVISRKFVDRLTEGNRLRLPWHRADKKVPCIDSDGKKISPSEPNAIKLETFIFDALPLADKTVILEACREKEFAPTKNKSGVDSVESCRKMLIERDAERLKKAGVELPMKDSSLDCTIELSPLKFIDDEDLEEYQNKVGFKEPEHGEEKYYG